MRVRYVDAHCHIQFEQYAGDDIELIERMQREGVVGIVVGVDHASSQKAIALAEKHEHLYAAVGLHPNRVPHESFDVSAYHALAMHPKVVAIGECGLDFFRPAEVNDEVKRAQKEVLHTHIQLAAELDKPLIIHARPSKGTQHPVGVHLPFGSPAAGDAYHDLIGMLKKAKTEHPRLRGDIHFFVGGVAEAQALIELDFTVSFTAVITFARDYDAVIKTLPLTNILAETDAPYVAPALRRGERNDPLAVVDVVSKIADIRGENTETVRQFLLSNAKRVFALSAIDEQ